MKNRKLWELIFYSNAEWLAGFYVVNRFGEGWDTRLVQITCSILAVLQGLFILLEKIEWVGIDAFRPSQTERTEPRKIPDLNAPIKINTMVVQGVKVDSEMMTARALIDMRNGNLDVNMTEAFWLNKINGTNRWQKLGGNGRKDFVDMLDRWESFGAIKREGGQGKRVVGDWQKVRKIEQGHKPPAP